MTLGNIPRQVVYGSFVGGVVGSLLFIAGWTSPDSSFYVFLGVSIMGCGILGGLAIGLAIELRAQPHDPTSRKRLTVGWLVAGMLAGLLFAWFLVPWSSDSAVYEYKQQEVEHIFWGSVAGTTFGAINDIGINLQRGRYRGWRLNVSRWTLLLLSLILAIAYGTCQMYLMIEAIGK